MNLADLMKPPPDDGPNGTGAEPTPAPAQNFSTDTELSDGALRVLRLAQGDDALTADERQRLADAEHRADLDRALNLASRARAEIAEMQRKAEANEQLRRRLLREFYAVTTRLTNGTATAQDRARLSRVNSGALRKALRKSGGRLDAIPLDAIKNF